MHRLAEESLAAATGDVAARADLLIAAQMRAWIDHDEGERLALVLASAPSAEVCRHLWRRLAEAWNAAAEGASLRAHVFALPVVLVAGQSKSATSVTMTGVIDRPSFLADILRTHGALRGNQTTVLAGALFGTDALDPAQLPRWRRHAARLEAGDPASLSLAPTPFVIGTSEGAHLRFLVGTALAAADADLFRDARIERFGAPLARALEAALAADDVTCLALPRPPSDPVFAVHAGRSAQREVAAQLFASQALRNLRTRFGEPSAVISAHRSADAPLGGELRLSLSSPFAERDAEGFRCPLYAADALGDVVKMLTDLMADCRVGDTHVVAGVHDDRAAGTGHLLLFRPETAPPGRSVLH